MKLLKLEQGSDEWKQWRRGVIGASDIPVILGKSPYGTPYTLWQRKLGFLRDKESTSAMEMGHTMEPVLRDWSNQQLGAAFVPAVGVHDKVHFAMASFDGIDTERREVLEIKWANAADHAIAVGGKVPEKYMPQVQWQLYVSGYDRGWYVSGNGEDRCAVLVERDEAFIMEALDAAGEFYLMMENMEPPPFSEEDFMEIIDPDFQEAAERWKGAKAALDDAVQGEKIAKLRLIELTDDSNCRGYGISLRRVNREGAIDWPSVFQELKEVAPDAVAGIDLEKHRKPQIGYWKVSYDAS